jgi:chloride channel protein, CIC family
MTNHSTSHAELSDFRADHRMLLLAAIAAPIGVISALVAKALLWLIAVITNLLFFHHFSGASLSLAHLHIGAWVIVIPVVGALIIGLMARYGSEKIRGHGIPEALEAILLGRSLIQPKVAILKPISSAISIGTGGPFGAEGPIIMTGGAFGSIMAQLFHLTAAERKTLLVAGAAAGMSAVFATPIAAVLLAVELLLFEWKPRSLIPVAVASIIASLVRVPLLGAGPMFAMTPHAPMTVTEIGSSCVIGLVLGFGSGLLTLMVYACEDLFEKIPIHWMWWPAIGAIFVGIGGWIDPRVLGVGYEFIHDLLRGEILGGVLIGLLVGKAVVWAISLGSGTSGGVLAPLLIIGGAMGAVVGRWLPGGDTGLWAMVGMAAMMGGTMRTPFTGLFFLLELTHDFNAVPVLLCGSVVALGVTVLLLKRSILTEKLARRGQHVAREYSVDPFELIRVGDVIGGAVPVAPAAMPLREFAESVAIDGRTETSQRHATFLVDGNNLLAGIITRGDVVRAIGNHANGGMTLIEAGHRDPIVTYPDETLQDAIAKMLKHNIGRLPVVERDKPRKIVGYLGRSGILEARQHFHRGEEVRERALRPEEFFKRKPPES